MTSLHARPLPDERPVPLAAVPAETDLPLRRRRVPHTNQASRRLNHGCPPPSARPAAPSPRFAHTNRLCGVPPIVPPSRATPSSARQRPVNLRFPHRLSQSSSQSASPRNHAGQRATALHELPSPLDPPP